MIKREDVIFDPTDPRVKELIGEKVYCADNLYEIINNPRIEVFKGISDSNVYPFKNHHYNYVFIAPIPEPTYRPFRSASEFKPYRDKWLIVKCGGGRMHTTYYDNQCVLVGKERFTRTYTDAFANIIFEDGTPFGVKE